MQTEFFLYFTRSGSPRLTVRQGKTAANEVRLRAVVDIPDSYFDRPEPEIAIVLPDRPAPADDVQVWVDLNQPEPIPEAVPEEGVLR